MLSTGCDAWGRMTSTVANQGRFARSFAPGERSRIGEQRSRSIFSPAYRSDSRPGRQSGAEGSGYRGHGTRVAAATTSH